MTEGRKLYEAFRAAHPEAGEPGWFSLPSAVKDAWGSAAEELTDGEYERGYEAAKEDFGGYREVVCPKCSHEFDYEVEV